MALIDLAYSAPIFDENAVLDALDSALNCEYLSNEEKLRFSQRKLDFLEDLGTDINKYVKYIFKKLKIYMSSDIYESELKWINCSENFNYNNTVLRKTELTMPNFLLKLHCFISSSAPPSTSPLSCITNFSSKVKEFYYVIWPPFG